MYTCNVALGDDERKTDGNGYAASESREANRK